MERQGGIKLNTKVNAANEDPVTVVEINGEFDRNGVFSAGPWYTYYRPSSSLTESVNGEYSLIVLDDKGERIEVFGFDAEDNFRITTRAGVSNPAGEFIPVSLVVRLDETASSIVVAKNDNEVYSRNISKHAPKIAFKRMSDDTEITDKVNVCWEASDEEDNEMYFKLWYRLGDKYYLLASDIQETSFEADLSSYPGSENSYFHLYATNGVRTAEAKSPPVKVQHKAPEILTAQKMIPVIKVTEEIYFKTEIYDAQDGKLSGDSVIWTLNGEKAAGTNVLRTKPYQLEPGKHSFICTATNSGGVSAQKEFVFEIIDDESDLPGDWSRPEIVRALKSGYIIPLIRIEAPVPRGQFMDLMSALLKNAGITEAFGEVSEPQKSLTEREALKILYETWALIKNPLRKIADNEYNENGAKELFINSGVFDQKDNIYEPDEKLSNKSALVWVYRVDKVLYGKN